MANLSNINNKFIVTDGGNGRVLIGATNDIGATLFANHPSTTAPSLTFNAPAGQVFENEDLQIAFGLNNASPYNGYMQTRFVSAPYYRNLAINPLGGNVGIGTNSPSEKLEVAGRIKSVSTGAAHLILNGDSNNSGDTGQIDSIIDFLGDGNPGIYGYRINTENWSGQTALNFQEYINGSYTSRLFISKDGNVGIGETNPENDNRLHIKYSDANVTPLSSSPLVVERNDVCLIQTLTSNASDAGILFGDGDDNDVGGLFYLHGSDAMTFRTNTSERMRIDSSGNVAISGYGIQIDRPDVAGGKPYIFWKSGGTTQASIYGASSGAGLRIFLSGGTAAFDNSISFTGIVQQNAQSVVLSNSAYANAAAVQAYATNTANVYPGYGFHKASVLGGFLYATSRTELRYRGDGGTDKVLLMADSDYEEGTWTPTSNLPGATVSSYGKYTKIGNIVYIAGKIDFTGKTGTAVNVVIDSLPFSGSNTNDAQTRPSAFPEGDLVNMVNLTNNYGHFRVNGNQMQGVIVNSSGNTIYMSSDNFSSSGQFNFSVVYTAT